MAVLAVRIDQSCVVDASPEEGVPMKPLLLWFALAQGADITTTAAALQRGCGERFMVSRASARRPGELFVHFPGN